MEHETSGISTFPEKKDNLERLTEIFETNFRKISFSFDFEPEFPEILVEWNAPQIVVDCRHLNWCYQVDPHSQLIFRPPNKDVWPSREKQRSPRPKE